MFLAFACVSAFAQDNVAAESAKKRMGGVDLLHPWKPLPPVRLNPSAPAMSAPGICATPLVDATPAINSRTPVLPPADVHDRMDVRVPAPACK